MKQPLTKKSPNRKPTRAKQIGIPVQKKVVISSIRWNRIHYIRDMQSCMNGTKYVPVWTDNPKTALDFQTLDYAQGWMDLLHPGAIQGEFDVQELHLPMSKKQTAAR